KTIFIFLTLTVIFTSSSVIRVDYRQGRFNNVCKDLRNDVLLYFIFIDTKETSPWTEFDIMSTIDSLGVAVRWLEKAAKQNKVELTIKTDYYIGNEFATINQNLPEKSVEESLLHPNLKKGIEALNKWADNVSRKAGESFYLVDKDGIPKTQPPNDAERLIAHLRDEYSVESVALMFMVNNYFKTDLSVALNTLTTEDVEFAIVSYKYPSEIAHNFLHLYGAADLHETPFRRSGRKIKIANDLYPDDIMQDAYAKNIDELKVSRYTKYLIGWTDEIDPEFEDLLTDRLINFL
ncbi:MAG: hypothetical protein ACOCWA_01330, partial [Bacteroidota bacterium]